MEIRKHTKENGVEYFEVVNPRAYSARYGDVYKTKDSIYCKCIQWTKYDHCSHVDFILGHQYMKGQPLT